MTTALDSGIATSAATARAPRPSPAWISFGTAPALGAMALHLTMRPGGAGEHIAACRPHAAWIEWRGGPPGF